MLKIGEVADISGEKVATIRYWVKTGLIEIVEITNGGYQLFEKEEIEKCRRIRQFQKGRYTLEEIKQKIEM